MSDKPVYQVRVRFNLWEDLTKEQYEGSKLGDGVPRILYPAAAYEALRKENEELRFKALAAISPRVKQSYEREIKGLEDQIEAQARRIAELEEHITKLGAGSRQHLYQAFARRYREILSLRRENEALRKQVEILLGAAQKTVLALAHASIHDPLYAQAYDELSESINLVSKNGDSK